MSDPRVIARVHDRPGALERVIGLLRRRAFAVRRLSLATIEEGLLEVVVRLDGSRTAGERVRTELLALIDVLDAWMADAPAHPRRTRELLLARLRSPAVRAYGQLGRIVADGTGGAILEITGAPEEVDAALARLRQDGLITGFVRSGDVALPMEAIHEPRADEG